ncbi:hypothetical protein ACTJJ4_11520 [Microbacterium sp. 22195]
MRGSNIQHGQARRHPIPLREWIGLGVLLAIGATALMLMCTPSWGWV